MIKKKRLGSSKDTLEYLEGLLDDIDSGNKDAKDVANALKVVAVTKEIRKMELLEKMRIGDKTPLWWLWDDSRPSVTLTNGAETENLPPATNHNEPSRKIDLSPKPSERKLTPEQQAHVDSIIKQKRPKAEYSNGSPYGFAKDFRDLDK